MNRIPVVASRVALLGAALVLGSGVVGMGSVAQAAPRKAALPTVGPPVWPGSRVAMVLPLKLGQNWNADQATGIALLLPSEEELVMALRATGKLEPVTADRFNPLFVRAVREARLTPAQLKTLTDAPSLASARDVLSTFNFDQSYMIVDCTIEEVRVGGTPQKPTLSMQVSGRIYEGNNETEFRTSVVTSDPVTGGRSNYERAILASSNGFKLLAAAFTAPLPDIDLGAPGSTPDAPKPKDGGNGTMPGMDLPADGTDMTPATPGKTPAATPPLPEVPNGGDVPMFPQGKLPLTPGTTPPATPAPAA